VLHVRTRISEGSYMSRENALEAVMIIGDVQPWSGGTQKQAISLAGELQLQGVSLSSGHATQTITNHWKEAFTVLTTH
jgi:hypothetical protein